MEEFASKTKLAVMEFDRLSGPRISRICSLIFCQVLFVPHLIRSLQCNARTVFDVMDKGILLPTHLIFSR